MTCNTPIELEQLVAYWLAELPEAAQARIEEHLMGCAHCTKRLEALAATAQGIRAAVRKGAIDIALTPRFLEHMKKEGLRIREYEVAPGETVNCTIRAEDDAVVSRLRAPLAGVTRLDVLETVELGARTERTRIEDVPFDGEAGEVLLTPSAAALRKMPAHTYRVQLLAVEESGERALGEYTFSHTPS